jgi:hypothetical protein
MILDWNAVKRTAQVLGVKDKAVEKWRQRNRGVPTKWWLPLVERSNGKISFDDLRSFNRRRREPPCGTL